VIVTINPKIKELFAEDDDQTAEANESLDKKLILASRLISVIEYLLEKALKNIIIFTNSSDNDCKIEMLMRPKATLR
jgi:hypothetical protein